MEEGSTVEFTYALPFIQTFLANRGLTEYHVYVKTTPEYKEAFRFNTQTNFTQMIDDYIANKYKKDIFYQGIGEDNNKEFIYLHFKSEVAEAITQRITEDLKRQYETIWIKHRIPSLCLMVKHNLKQTLYLANALSHYQKDNGFQEAQCMINLFFEHMNIT
jgi:hypothetical protein